MLLLESGGFTQISRKHRDRFLRNKTFLGAMINVQTVSVHSHDKAEVKDVQSKNSPYVLRCM